MTRPPCWTAVETVAALRAGKVTCEQLVRDAVAASRRAHAATNCFVEIEADRALALARRLDCAEGSGAMLGVPYAVKDLFVRQGVPPSIGVRTAQVRTRAVDSTCLDRLDRQGAIPLGRLNLDAYGYAATGLNDALGDVRNPWNTDHIAGGSSSGAAAAVAAGAVPIAIGSDTAGSVRIPAALCGVVGFKPTYGRIPRTGCVPLSYSQDTIGIIARTVEDVALAVAVMSGHDPGDPSSFDVPAPAFDQTKMQHSLESDQPLSGIRIGVDDEYLNSLCAEEVLDAVRSGCAILGDLGAQIVPISLAALTQYDVAASVLTWCEAGAIHQDRLATDRAAYPDSIRTRLYQALTTHGTDHVNALRVQGMVLRDFLRDVLGRCDVIATCAAPMSAPRIDATVSEPLATTTKLLNTNRPFNFLGLPAITVPTWPGSGDLPLGLQFVSRPWAESSLLHVAAVYQRHAASPAGEPLVPPQVAALLSEGESS
jgi:aspartyl-tRNA(Asn)/glutamyl-tRNA(Gln) amidotransferase subunit A